MYNKKHLFILFLITLFLSGCAVQDPELIRQQAYQAYQSGDYITAADSFEILTEKVPADAELWFRLGNSYARSMMPQKAIQAYQNTLLRDPAMGKPRYNMALIHIRSALKSLVDMQSYVSEDDPAFVKGKEMREGLFTLLKQDDDDPVLIKYLHGVYF